MVSNLCLCLQIGAVVRSAGQFVSACTTATAQSSDENLLQRIQEKAATIYANIRQEQSASQSASTMWQNITTTISARLVSPSLSCLFKISIVICMVFGSALGVSFFASLDLVLFVLRGRVSSSAWNQALSSPQATLLYVYDIVQINSAWCYGAAMAPFPITACVLNTLFCLGVYLAAKPLSSVLRE